MRCLFAAVFLCGVSLHAQELQNGDFAQGLKKWQVAAPKNGEVAKEVIEDGREGKPVLKITVGNVGEIDNVVSLNQGGLLINDGMTYTISFWAKCEPGPAKINVCVTFFNTGLLFLARPQKMTLTSKWTQYTYTFKASAVGEKSSLSFNNLGANNSVFYFSDIQLSETAPQQ